MLAPAAVSCAITDEDDAQSLQRDLVAIIEARVELPEEAWPIADYGRNYAIDDNGKVVAIYHLTSSNDDRWARRDEVRWFDSTEELPMIMDGGCSVITVIYNPQTEHLSAFCNGVA